MRAKSARASTITRRRIPRKGISSASSRLAQCALLVMRLMEAAEMELTKEQRKLVVLAMYLDTIALRSSKISIDERRWAREEAVRLGHG